MNSCVQVKKIILFGFLAFISEGGTQQNIFPSKLEEGILQFNSNGAPSKTPTGTERDECTRYRELDEETRSSNYGKDTYCDSTEDLNSYKKQSPSWFGPGWYRFTGKAGTKMSEKPLPWQTCGTIATGWIKGSHPTEVNQQKDVLINFNWDGNKYWRSTIGRVTYCTGEYFVYYLPNVPECHSRYCGVSTTTTTKLEGQCVATKSTSDCLEFERYRSYSGRCNNLKNPEQGAARDVQQRLLPAEYEDSSISSPRSKNKLGTDLPSPRTVSQKVHTDMAKLDSKFTVMLMQWGQFIDHDFNLTPHIEDSKQCEDCSKDVNSGTCFPIKIKSGDSFFNGPNDPKCFSFARSEPSSGANRNQINVLSSYLDGSMVYGSSESLMNELREDNSYLMKVLDHPDSNRGLLPTTDKSECSSVLGYCFLAGDIRVNEQPGLTTTHTIFVREHNRIANSLAGMNPHWEVNRVFEETRRIISAQIQHITYNEFLPHVLGPNRLSKFGVNLQSSGYFSGYDESCSAAPFNEFSTAAFRFGHSMIPPHFTAISEEAITDASLIRPLIRQLPLRDHFFNPDLLLEPNTMDDLLRGLTIVPMQPVDRFVTEELTNHLFEKKTVPKSGLDLPSLNIQRGRDHGLPGYNKYREVCNLQKAQVFTDLKNEMTDDTIAKLMEVYSHPDDIDLYTGLLSETPQTEALTGPTLACIIGQQFKNLRQCDRYWYETSDPKIRFTQEQLKELRSSNLAALICKNMDKNSKFSRTPMKQVDVKRLVDCEKDIRSIDLEAWREGSSLDYVSLTKFNEHEKQYQELVKTVSRSANKPDCGRPVLPEQCKPGRYNTLSELSRNYKQPVKQANCDGYGGITSPSWVGQGWYKFANPAGTRIATSDPIESYKWCGTHAPGYMIDDHPTEIGQTKNVKFCFRLRNNPCYRESMGEVTKCGEGDFVYKLPNVPTCALRYCAAP